jgi:hypothetical protein
MAMAEKFNTGQEVCLQIDPQRAWSYASQRGNLWVTNGRTQAEQKRCALLRTADIPKMFALGSKGPIAEEV